MFELSILLGKFQAIGFRFLGIFAICMVRVSDLVRNNAGGAFAPS